MNPTSPRTASLGRIFGYALGEGAVSITMNGIANFAMLYYTQVLGLGAGYAALFVLRHYPVNRAYMDSHQEGNPPRPGDE